MDRVTIKSFSTKVTMCFWKKTNRRIPQSHLQKHGAITMVRPINSHLKMQKIVAIKLGNGYNSITLSTKNSVTRVNHHTWSVNDNH